MSTQPVVDFFKPRGVPMRGLTRIALPLEGLEALRLVDLEGLKQQEAALQMNVSRATFQRVLARARHVVAEALINGWALQIEGGHYSFVRPAPSEPQGRGLKVIAAEQRKKPGADMTKIAVTSVGPSLDDLLDARFGRAAGFIVIDPNTLEFEYVDNGATQVLAQGAGIQAAELIADAGATILLTGFVGPKAFRALTAAGIKVGQNLENLTVREAVARFSAGDVDFAEQPNKDSHWS